MQNKSGGNRERFLRAREEYDVFLISRGCLRIGEYRGSGNPCEILASCGHTCSPTPGNAKRKDRGICKVCGNISRGESRSERAWSEFKASLLNDWNATVIEEQWLGANIGHRVLCRYGHECLTIPTAIQQGHGPCSICAGNNPDVAENEFRARMAMQGALIIGTYKGSTTPVEILCKNGHTSFPRPANTRSQNICRPCSGYDPITAEANFRSIVIVEGGIIVGEYKDARTRCEIECKRGHRAFPLPSSVTQGIGICRYCRGAELGHRLYCSKRGYRRAQIRSDYSQLAAASAPSRQKWFFYGSAR